MKKNLAQSAREVKTQSELGFKFQRHTNFLSSLVEIFQINQ